MKKDVIEFTDANFEEEVLKSEIPVVVDFWASWCGPCKVMEPIVDEVASEYKGRVKVGKLNVDDNMSIATRYNIMSIPTVLFFNGGEVADTIIGVVPKDEVIKKIEDLLR